MNMQAMAKDNTLEINAAHPIIVNLNQLRKTNKVMASLVAKQLLDNVMIQSGIPYDMNEGIDRRYKMITQFLEMTTDSEPTQATRKEIPIQAEEPAMKKAQNLRSESADRQQVVAEHTVGKEDLK